PTERKRLGCGTYLSSLVVVHVGRGGAWIMIFCPAAMSKDLYTTFLTVCNYGNSVRLKRSSRGGGPEGRVTCLCQVAGIAPGGQCSHPSPPISPFTRRQPILTNAGHSAAEVVGRGRSGDLLHRFGIEPEHLRRGAAEDIAPAGLAQERQ